MAFLADQLKRVKPSATIAVTDKARAHHPTLGVPPESNAQTGWLDEITILHLASQTAGSDKPGGFVPLLSALDSGGNVYS